MLPIWQYSHIFTLSSGTCPVSDWGVDLAVLPTFRSRSGDTQAPLRRGFCISEAYTQNLPSLKAWAVPRKVFCGEPLCGTGKGITNCLSGSSTPRFFVKNKKSVPSGVLKMQSLACIFALRAGLVGARNLPLRFDSTQLAGAVRANPHQLRWRGLARSSCDLVRVNSFLSPSLLHRRAGQVDRIEAAR